MVRGIFYVTLGIITCLIFIPTSSETCFLTFDRISQDEYSSFTESFPSALSSFLQWYAPPGEKPGTFTDYLKEHPYTKATFHSPGNILHSSFVLNLNTSISILVDNTLYPKIMANLQQYITDLETMGHTVFLQTLSGGNPEDVKAWIQNQYTQGSRGIVFIGDIPAAWAEVSESTFPCDLFYMDLDGTWEDKDGDGIYETHEAGNGDMGPELYVGRMYANTLTYDTEANMINDYLEKTHAYRVGNLTQPWRGLEYVDEDWYDMDVYLNQIYGQNVERYDYGYRTTAEDYLDKLQLGQHFVQVCAHSYSGGHHFGTRPTEAVSYAHVYVYSPTDRLGKLLLGCDDGIKVWFNGENIFTKDRLGGWFADQYKIDVDLKAGWNQLLCKISQDGGDYQFSARFTDTSYHTFDDLKYQISDPEIHGGMPEFIRSWLLNGFHQDVPDNFYSYLTTNYLGVDEATVQPEEGEEMGGKTWTRYDVGNPYIDLDDYSDEADFGVIYAYTSVVSAMEQSCQLWVGYDDGARVWLNGEEILFDNRYGGFTPDMKKVNVTLLQGENHLLLKISEWMGSHGFSARFSTVDGEPVEGLTYTLEPTPITYIGTWLVNGVYENPDSETRLSTDYLGGEESVRPSEHDSAPDGTWELGIGGYPFDVGKFFDHGGWVFSETIQEEDPPVLFYNLFSCGPGRFTDEDYLAGSYIFHTTYGLITIASSKSGSMLNFKDFTEPLGQGKSIGEAFAQWFDAQAPYQKWEKEWYYGMVICGDPTLHVFPSVTDKPQVQIKKPQDALYFFDEEVFPFIAPVVVGDITVETVVTNPGMGIVNVTFFVDDVVVGVDDDVPYECLIDERGVGRKTIKIVAVDCEGNVAVDSIDVFLLNLGIF